MSAPLSGMKILDFTYLLPGPFGTMMLADLGAEIIKVENLQSPDMLRLMPPYINGVSAAYAHINRGKRSLSLNLKAPGGADIVRTLAGEYDIILEQFRPGVMERLGLGYQSLREINPRLIYCSLTGYGQTGAYADRAGHDINYMALSGIESFSGRSDAGPALSGVQIADLSGGSKNLVIAVLAAYIKRLATGQGEQVDVSITEGMFSMTALYAAGYLAGGQEPIAEGEALNGGSVYDFYRTADGRYLSVGPIEPKFLKAFAAGIGFEDLPARLVASPESLGPIKEQVAQIIASRPLDHWVEIFGGADACVEPVRTLGEAASSPPLADRDMIVEVASHAGSVLRQISSPMVFSGTRYCAGFAGTPLGHDTSLILGEAGYTPEDLARLRAEGVI